MVETEPFDGPEAVRDVMRELANLLGGRIKSELGCCGVLGIPAVHTFPTDRFDHACIEPAYSTCWAHEGELMVIGLTSCGATQPG